MGGTLRFPVYYGHSDIFIKNPCKLKSKLASASWTKSQIFNFTTSHPVVETIQRYYCNISETHVAPESHWKMNLFRLGIWGWQIQMFKGVYRLLVFNDFWRKMFTPEELNSPARRVISGAVDCQKL